MVDKALNTGFDAVKNFAKGEWFKRKAPIIAKHAESVADKFRDHLSNGYNEIINGSGGGGSNNSAMENVEKNVVMKG